MSGSLDRSFENAVEIITRSEGKVVVMGVGKSGLVGQKISATLSSTGTPSLFLHAGESLHGDLGVVEEKDTVLIFSMSGSTDEIASVLPALKKINAPTVANNISIPATGGWQTWETVTVEDVQLTAGTHIMRVTIGESDYINLNNVTCTSNDVDECPDDPNKTEPGICGCGTPDIDSDGDGTMDCNDECPDDPNKTEPGLCGCGVEEGNCEQIVELTAGWNLIGSPISGETDIEIALSSIWQYVEEIKDFNGFYAADNNPNLQTITSIQWGTAYLIKVSQNCALNWK
ncbi:MAG: SIS domain-containing protein [Bacteroidales bacterium]